MQDNHFCRNVLGRATDGSGCLGCSSTGGSKSDLEFVDTVEEEDVGGKLRRDGLCRGSWEGKGWHPLYVNVVPKCPSQLDYQLL